MRDNEKKFDYKSELTKNGLTKKTDQDKKSIRVSFAQFDKKNKRSQSQFKKKVFANKFLIMRLFFAYFPKLLPFPSLP